MAEKTAEELKTLLGEDYEAYVAFKAARDKKAQISQAKGLATAMVSEGGEYFDQYDRLNKQMDAIWDKAMSKSRKQVGIAETEEGEETS